MTVRTNYNTLLSEVRIVNRALGNREIWLPVHRMLSTTATNIAFFSSKRSHP